LVVLYDLVADPLQGHCVSVILRDRRLVLVGRFWLGCWWFPLLIFVCVVVMCGGGGVVLWWW